MRLNARYDLMVDRAQVEIVLHGLEARFDLDELDVELPQLGWVLSAQIGAQEIAAFTPPHGTQLFAIELVGELGSLGIHLDIDQTPCRACLLARGAKLHEQFL